MGSLHKPKFTRAQRGRSDRTTPKPRRKPARTLAPTQALRRDEREARADAILQAARAAARPPGQSKPPRSKKKTLSPAAMKRRLAKRKLVTNIGTASVDALREMRDAGDGPNLPGFGGELRDVVTRLKRMEAYLIVAGMALDETAGHSGYVVVLLRSAVGNLLFKQIRALEDLAARCDGGPSSDRDHEDDPAEDEDSDMDACEREAS